MIAISILFWEVTENMSESTNILALMVRDHCKIEQLLNELELNAEKEYPTRLKSFNKFYKLNFGTLLAVSMIHGRTIMDSLDILGVIFALTALIQVFVH